MGDILQKLGDERLSVLLLLGLITLAATILAGILIGRGEAVLGVGVFGGTLFFDFMLMVGFYPA